MSKKETKCLKVRQKSNKMVLSELINEVPAHVVLVYDKVCERKIEFPSCKKKTLPPVG